MKEYLGDSVYAEAWDGDGVKLTTENGGAPDNIIFMEREVIAAFMKFVGVAQ